MDFGSFGAGFGSFGSSSGVKQATLAGLSPFAVYGATDLMGTGGDIIRLRAGSSEEDFTEAELYGSESVSYTHLTLPTNREV